MPFRCPQCMTRDSLEIFATIELPPDHRSEEISLQVVKCSGCQFRGLAVYEESRFDRPDGNEWAHIGYWASPDAIDSVLNAIQMCPTPLDRSCQCDAHQSLSVTDTRGIWSGLMEMERGHTFLMRLAL